MKLASLKTQSRDGQLVVVSENLQKAVKISEGIQSMQGLLENWDTYAAQLEELYTALNTGYVDSAFAFDPESLAAPLPRAYQWLDGSAYLPHVRRVRQARGAEMPPSFEHDPLMYQGGSDIFLGPKDPIMVADESWGIDCEGEIAIVTGDVPIGTQASDAMQYIKLVMLVNDVSLRNLIPGELGKGFGFVQSKPPTAFSPVAVTPDVLGDAWFEAKLQLPLITTINGEVLGEPNAGDDMQFNFLELIEHAAKTRPLGAGTIIGSGTVSNEDEALGGSCLAEQRVLEVIHEGEASTPFLKYGDQVRIEMLDESGFSIFGAIEQAVMPLRRV